MTDKLLEGMASQVHNMARTELRYRRQLNCVLAVYYQGTGLERLRELELDLEKRAGPQWIDRASARDALFAILSAGSLLPDQCGPDAIVAATAVTVWESTEAMNRLPMATQQEMAYSGRHRHMPEYFRKRDLLLSVAQSEERVCLYAREFLGKFLFGSPEVKFLDQREWHGRIKFYGDVKIPEEVQAFVCGWVKAKS